jgi:hypothetical protein
MKPKTSIEQNDELRPEYDFAFLSMERGRYAKRIKLEGSTIFLVESNLAKGLAKRQGAPHEEKP